MAIMQSYLLSKQNLQGILEAIQRAHAPERFTIRFLEGLGFKSNTDRAVVGVLKGLGFLSESGAPTDRYVAFMDSDNAPYVLGEAIQEAYSGLFEVRRDAENMTVSEAKNKIKTLMQGKVKDAVLAKMGMTFTALCALANFDHRTNTAPADIDERKAEDVPQGEAPTAETMTTPKRKVPDAPGAAGDLSSLLMNYRIELVLPPSKDKAVYDALFASLKEHLLK